MNLNIVIMAAGKGTRMGSTLPKVMHPIGGKPMVEHVLRAVEPLAPSMIVTVTGYGAPVVERHVSYHNNIVFFVRQEPQLGTGHAVLQALPYLDDEGYTVILNGDTPLISTHTIAELVAATADFDHHRLGLLTVRMYNPAGYGRIMRDQNGDILKIIEQKDCTPAEAEIKEVYTGILCVPNEFLRRWLPNLSNDNAQGEYYLTDIVKMAAFDCIDIVATQPTHIREVIGVNTPAQLAELEALYQETK